MTNPLTRQGFVARGALAAGTLVVPGLARAAKRPKTHPVYRLDPTCGHSTTSCKTCTSYAKKFLFPTRKAANGNRPHKGCNCCIQGGKLVYGTYVAIFGNPKKLKRYRADRQKPAIKKLLKRHPPVFG
jgi:hypothetical protein